MSNIDAREVAARVDEDPATSQFDANGAEIDEVERCRRVRAAIGRQFDSPVAFLEFVSALERTP